MTGPLNVDILVLCSESEEDLKRKKGCFVEVFRRGLNVSIDKNGVRVL